MDAQRGRVHIRDAKGNKDRLVPLPEATLALLRRFWQLHRNPVLLFPNRHGCQMALKIFQWVASKSFQIVSRVIGFPPPFSVV